MGAARFQKQTYHATSVQSTYVGASLSRGPGDRRRRTLRASQKAMRVGIVHLFPKFVLRGADV